MLHSRRPSAQALISAGVVGAAALYVFVQLSPSLLFANTTPSGGDMGAHVWMPAFLRDHLLPKGRLTGWTPDWYAGFPALSFYFPLPSLLIVLLDVVLPYGVAFKLVSVSGLVALPVAGYAFGRLAGMAFPAPPLLAVATVPFLFDRTKDFTIWGGNVPSTLAGEFSFSIALALALVFLGVVARGLETGRHRAWAAALLAVIGLCHILPTLFAVAGAVVLLLLRADGRRLRYVVGVLVVGALLAAFWTLPFLASLDYVNDMGWEKSRDYVTKLFPPNLRWVLALAAAGAISALALGRRNALALVGLGLVSAAAFLFVPEARLWNARFLPFWYLTLYLLAAVAVAEVSHAFGSLLSGDPDRPWWPGVLATPVVGALIVGLSVGIPLARGRVSALQSETSTRISALQATTGRPVPPDVAERMAIRPSLFDRLLTSPRLSKSTDSSFIPSWVRWNYSGYERKPAHGEYRALVDTMAQLPCGRAMWEYEPKLDRYGTPMALMLLPYWTKGCIGSMEGLFFESSATTPYHFLNQAELSKQPSNPQRDLPYGTLDLNKGIRHLQLLGARYYMAFSPEALAQARAHPDLRLVAKSAPWEIFEVRGWELVTPLSSMPAVLDPVPEGQREWLDVAVRHYMEPERWSVPLAAAGPPDWPRVAVRRTPTTEERVGAGVVLPNPPVRRVAPVTVSNIRTGDDHLSFTVDRPGSPVLVKTSYFPNWEASGAKGPWRVTPNLMVVVPTSRSVELRYGTSLADRLGWVVTALGLIGLVALARRPAFGPPEPEVEQAELPFDDRQPITVGAAARWSGPGAEGSFERRRPAKAPQTLRDG